MASFTGMFVNSWVGSIKPFYEGEKKRRERWRDEVRGRKHIKVEDKHKQIRLCCTAVHSYSPNKLSLIKIY